MKILHRVTFIALASLALTNAQVSVVDVEIDVNDEPGFENHVIVMNEGKN